MCVGKLCACELWPVSVPPACTGAVFTPDHTSHVGWGMGCAVLCCGRVVLSRADCLCASYVMLDGARRACVTIRCAVFLSLYVLQGPWELSIPPIQGRFFSASIVDPYQVLVLTACTAIHVTPSYSWLAYIDKPPADMRPRLSPACSVSLSARIGVPCIRCLMQHRVYVWYYHTLEPETTIYVLALHSIPFVTVHWRVVCPT